MVKQSAKTATAPKKYIPVNIPEEIYQVYKSYSQLTGVPVARAIRDGLQEYADVQLTVRLEVLAEQIKDGKGILQPHAVSTKQPAREAAQRGSN